MKKSSKAKNNLSSNHTIRLYHVYEELGNLKGQVSQIDKKLDTVISNHGDRINENERKIDQFEGKAAGIALAVSLIVSIIGVTIAILRIL